MSQGVLFGLLWRNWTVGLGWKWLENRLEFELEEMLGWERLQSRLAFELEEILDWESLGSHLEIELERRRGLGSVIPLEDFHSTLSEAGAVGSVPHYFEEVLLIPACFAGLNSG
jgi:hypothetical protein